jgi:hypothetical protein
MHVFLEYTRASQTTREQAPQQHKLLVILPSQGAPPDYHASLFQVLVNIIIVHCMYAADIIK